MNDPKFRSRKFLIVAGTLICSFLALISGQLDSGSFAAIAVVCIGAYTASNSYEGRNKGVG